MVRRVFCVSCLVLVGTSLFAAAKDEAAADARAGELVVRALEAGIAGDLEKRGELLAEAIKASPDYGPARWHLGQLKIDGKWQTPTDVAAATSKDERYAEYRKLRDLHGGTPAGQLVLARWCQKQGLAEEAKLHWQGVLFFNANQPEAIKALGLHKFRDRWLTAAQIERVKQNEQEFEKSRDHWKVKLQHPVETIEHRPSGRDEALTQLRQIDDPAAIPWLEACVSPRSSELALEVVAILGRIDHLAAIDSLVRHAMGAKFEEVRIAAAKELAKRPVEAFVGPLVESLTSRPEVKTWTLYMPKSSTVSVASSFLDQKTSVHVETMRDERDLQDRISMIGPQSTRANVAANGNLNVQNNGWDVSVFAWRAAGRDRSLVADAAALEARNIRICELLQRTTGLEYGRDQSQWWKWWLDLHDQAQPTQKPKREYVSGYVSPNATQVSIDPIGVGPGGAGTSSCFSGDTLIHSKTGLTPIAKINPGDFVLSRDIATGEIAYKVVLERTTRRGNQTLQLRIGDDVVESTRSHPFWVSGNGWAMAKQLAVGDLVCGVSGEQTVLEVNEDKEESVFNLIVADFGTYFVGKSGLLVHDFTAVPPTQALVPGLE